MSEELKPCRFCGSKSITIGYFGQPAQTIFATCQVCGATGPTHQYYGGIGGPVIDLGESWNRRVTSVLLESAPQSALTDEQIVEVADDNDSGRTTSGRRLFSDRNLLAFARALLAATGVPNA